MAFTNTNYTDIPNVGAGESWGQDGRNMPTADFEDNIKIGHFVARDANGLLQNSAITAPVVGVLLRDVAFPIEMGAVVTKTGCAAVNQVAYRVEGPVTVQAAAGATPPKEGEPVFSDATGLAVAAAGTETTAKFLYKLPNATDVWLVDLH